MATLTRLLVNRFTLLSKGRIEVLSCFGPFHGAIGRSETIDVVFTQIGCYGAHVRCRTACVTLPILRVTAWPGLFLVNVEGVREHKFRNTCNAWHIRPLANATVTVAVVTALHQCIYIGARTRKCEQQ